MGIVLGVSGFAGVGKSTAVRYLTETFDAYLVYVGAFVLDEVIRRGLPPTPDSEREVRLDLRRSNKTAIMRLGIPSIVSTLGAGSSVVTDAVLLVEELDLLRSLVKPECLYVAVIESPIDMRCERLAHRANRPYSRDDVIKRDDMESRDLRTDLVFAAARHRLHNDGTMESFRSALNHLARVLGLVVRCDLPGHGWSGMG